MSSTRLKYYLRGLGIGIIVTAVIMGVSAGTKPAELTDAQIVARAKELGMVDGVLAQLPAAQEEKEAEQTADAAKTDAKAEDAAKPEEKAADAAKTDVAKSDEKAADAAKADAAKADDKAEDAATADTAKTDAAKADDKAADAAKADAAKADAAKSEEKAVDAAKTDAAKTDAKAEDAAKADAAKTDVAKQDAKAEDAAKADTAKADEVKAEPEVVSKVVITIYPGEGSYTVSRKLAALGLVESADIYDKFLCQNGYDKKLITGNHEIEAGMTADEIARALTRRSYN